MHKYCNLRGYPVTPMICIFFFFKFLFQAVLAHGTCVSGRFRGSAAGLDKASKNPYIFSISFFYIHVKHIFYILLLKLLYPLFIGTIYFVLSILYFLLEKSSLY